ncbi:MAG: hypothetical protein H5U38_10275 [Calditrichaeota bacterium]|nr:hypothetical protein [Calditrichota bacterium]
MTATDLQKAFLLLVVVACGAFGSLTAAEPSQAALDETALAAQPANQASDSAVPTPLLAEGIEEWGRPAYRPFVAAFYLAIEVLATLATAFFIFVVLLKREEE